MALIGDGTIEANLWGKRFRLWIENDKVVKSQEIDSFGNAVAKPVNGTPSQGQAKNGRSHNVEQQGNGTSGNGNGQAKEADKPDVEPPKLNNGFKLRLSSVLTDNKYDRRLPKRRRGKLAMQGLWRVEAGQANVFSQKQARKGKHYSVVLVVDRSGSMVESAHSVREIKKAYRQGNTEQAEALINRSRYEVAVEVATFLGRHFEALDIDYSIVNFDNHAEIVKPFDKPMDEQTVLEGLKPDGGTDMHLGISKALEQLATARGRKLVIVISDGETKNPKETTRLVKANSHSIDFFGVGIGGEDCKVIPDHKGVTNTQDLQPVILDWLGRHVKRGI